MTMISDNQTTLPDKKREYPYKYRGIVLNNIDPMKMGRCQIMCVEVLGPGISSWAMPCAPMTGIQAGIYCTWPIGAKVWVEFEHGDPDYPIIAGGFWANPGEIPVISQATQAPLTVVQLATQLQNQMTISDTPGPTGGFILTTNTGAGIIMNDAGIIISNGRGAIISMVGPAVDVNFGALTVI
jgi:Type VI secretion system/phage-baseplate injector OB domain